METDSNKPGAAANPAVVAELTPADYLSLGLAALTALAGAVRVVWIGDAEKALDDVTLKYFAVAGALLLLTQIRKRPLLATLDAAVASFGKGDFTPALNQLVAFQNKIRAQVTPEDPSLAQSLDQAVQRIIDALTRPPRAVTSGKAPRLVSSGRQPHSPWRFSLVGEPGRSYTVQVSTDLVRWTAWTNFIATSATNQVTDPAANVNRRFYRAVTP